MDRSHRTGKINLTLRHYFFVCLVLLLAGWVFLPLPKFEEPYSLVILDRAGELLNATVASDGQWRFPASEVVPDKYLQCAVLFEDKRFFKHRGVDPLALLRAAWSDIRAGKVVSGGSTLTMQVVRLSRSGQPRTILEKIVEMYQALRLESFYNKQQIFTLYATHAPFGGNVVGLSAASWRYFGRRPEQLSWAEVAMLTVLPNNPALIHPGRNRDLLLKKRNVLLDRLLRCNVLDSLTCSLAKTETLPAEPYPLPMLAPHVYDQLHNGCPESGDGLSAHNEWGTLPGPVYTTIRKDLQLQTQQIIARHHDRLRYNGIYNAAALIVEVNSGEVLSYVGNVFNPENSEHDYFVDIITSPRSTGSILKPLLYAGMLQSGDILPTHLIADVPTRMGGFAPQNYSREYQGAVPAYKALAHSLNVPAVNMLQRFGVDRFQTLLVNLGMTTLYRPARDYGLTLILGGAEGKLWDLTGIYAGLARTVNRYFEQNPQKGSAFFAPRLILDKESNQSLPARDPILSTMKQSNPLQAGPCWLTLQAMLEVTRPDEESAWRNYVSSQRIAWKTGTSYGYRDGWAIGVTPRYAVGVWVGNADGEGRPDLTGIKTAAPILFEIFGLLPASGWFDCPEGNLEYIEVCSKSGYRRGPNCDDGIFIRVPAAGVQSPVCPYCQLIHCDHTLNWQVHADCEPLQGIVNKNWFVLPPTMEWYYIRKHSDYMPLPPLREDCRNAQENMTRASFSIIYPEKNSTIFIPVEIDGQRGRTVFKAAARNPNTTIYWHLDNMYMGSTRDIHELALVPQAGQHILTLVDENGEQEVRKFNIIIK
jgi:penicillin-binding protein 1C